MLRIQAVINCSPAPGTQFTAHFSANLSVHTASPPGLNEVASTRPSHDQRPSKAAHWAQLLLHCNRLRKIAREVDVEAFSNGKPVCHQLKRNDIEKTLQCINCAGNLDPFGLGRGELLIALGADDDRSTFTSDDCDCVSDEEILYIPKRTLLECIERLRENFVSSKDHDDGKILIDKSQNTMFQFTRHDCFTVQVGDLFDLKSTLQGGRKLITPSE